MPQNAIEEISFNPNKITLRELLINFKKTYIFLKSKSLFLITFFLLGFICGFIYVMSDKTKYVSYTTFVLDESVSGSGSLSQYAGLASIVGLDLGGGSGGIFKEENLLELYASKTIIRKTLLSNFPNRRNEFFIDDYIQIYGLKKNWPKSPAYQNLNFYNLKDSKFNRQQDSIIITIINDINKNCLAVSKPDKKTDIIQVKVTSINEEFSKYFNDQIVNVVNQFYIKTKTQKASQNLLILQHQTDSVRNALNNAITNVATSIDVNPNVNLSRQILRVPSQKRQFDADANKAILTQLVQNLEIAKVALRKETPLIILVDTPMYPLQKDKKSKILYGLIIGFLSASLTSLILILNRILRDSVS